MNHRSVNAIGALALLGAAAAVAIAFRTLPAAMDLRAMTWDAAQHAIIGLDVYDHIRRVEPVALLLRLQAEHWWPPLFGILSLPAWMIGGRELSSPSLVSFASYCLIPPFAWLAVRRLTSRAAAIAIALIALFFLRSPQMLEMSTWSMLEPVAALFTVASLGLFLAGAGTRARNWAYGLAGASTLLKYHYGFFLLVTLGSATWFELPPDERRNVVRASWSRVRRFWIPLTIVALLAIARRLEESVSSDPRLPGVPTIIWIGYVAALIVIAVRRAGAREFWVSVPGPIRRFVSCGLIWPMITVVDPSKAQAWYRQLGVVTDPPATLSVQLDVLRRYLTDDYFFGQLMLIAAAAGLLLCLIEGARRSRADVLAVGLHAIWPIALMTLSKYRIEPRFLATMIAAMMLAAVIGWTLALERRWSATVGVALVAVLIADAIVRTPAWHEMMAKRRVYFYLSSDPPHGFVVATVAAFSQRQPVLIVLPRDIEVVSPTIRLGLRLAMPAVSPADVVVRGGGEQRFAERLGKFRGGFAGVETSPADLQRLAAASGLRVESLTRGPVLPDGSRALLVAHLRISPTKPSP